MIKIAIVIGSTRPNRKGEVVARWVHDLLKSRTDAEFELVDIRDYNLPLLDEPVPPSVGNYLNAHTKVWSVKVSAFDGFIFVTPEYNHGTCGALKNAIDFLYKEWNNKACGFVSYGSNSGTRAVEQLRQVMAEIQIADVRAQVALSTVLDYENRSVFKPKEYHLKEVAKMADQVVAWSAALQPLRAAAVTSAPV